MYPYENFLFSAVAAHASQVLKTADPQRAAASLKAAKEDYAATLRQHPGWTNATVDEAAFGALASVELYRATGKRIYAEQAAHFGQLLMQCQEQSFLNGLPLTGYFYTSTKRDKPVHDHHSSFAKRR